MSGKKGLSISIDSDLSVKEKGRKKNEIRKIPQQNKSKLPTKENMTIVNIFRKTLKRLVKTQFQQIKQQSCLRKQIKWNSSMSTFQYELLPLPDSVRKCLDEA